MNLFALLEQPARRFPQHIAVCLGTQSIWTYAELRSRALRIAAGLRRRWRAAERIAIVSENRPEYLELLFGIWAAGLVAVPINAKLHSREILQIVENAEASTVFASANLAAHFAESTIVIGEEEYAGLMADELPSAVTVDPEALAWLFYTSGTTGRSKGAMLSHRNLTAMSIAHLADVEAVEEGATLIHAAPMSHGSGLYALPYAARGARHVIPTSSSFDADEFLQLCDQYPACSAFLAPTMVQRLRVEAERSGRRPRGLRTIVYGGGPMYIEELKKSLRVFGQVFIQIYGQGEAPMTITSLRRADHLSQDDAILGSVGWPRSGVEVVVVGPDGIPLPIGDIGEIVCRGDVVMAGYWNNPDASTEALRNGWLYTGDIGAIDARGYVTLRDRSKDLVITGGANVYPREVEEALLAHPRVAEVCVIGQPDAEWGEIVVAFVVPAKNAGVTERELDAHCLAMIGRYKRPKRYLFVDAVPKNSYGKVLKRELRHRL